MRVALFGSPPFALPVLEVLLEHHDIALVVSQPDKPAGRGKRLTSPPVAKRAKELGLRLEQPRKLKTNESFHELVKDLQLDVAVTAAYGKILPQSLLDIPKHGFLNVHASLLPKYRGAAPIQWALINGEDETGITIMQTEAGLDTGPVRLQNALKIEPHDTALTLFDKLAELGAASIDEALRQLDEGRLPCLPQDDSQASYAGLLSKEDGNIRWGESATAIYNRFRGVYAWPGSFSHYHGQLLKVLELAQSPQSPPAPLHKGGAERSGGGGIKGRGAERSDGGGINGKGIEDAQTDSIRSTAGQPGEILELDASGIHVATGEGSILLKTVQPAGKAKMEARAWANGYSVKVGDRLG